jgi:UDP:flavonoid glycosyltransferase YjiC (YdhE family)
MSKYFPCLLINNYIVLFLNEYQKVDDENQNMSQDNRPLIGFFPLFYYLSEAGRAVLVAKRYREMGGKAIFFSHGGEYEYFAKDLGFEIIQLKPYLTEDFIKQYKTFARGENKEDLFTESFISEAVENEVKVFKETGIKILVSTNNELSAISARAAKIPLIAITTGPGKFQYSIPDIYENNFTRLIPQFIKIRLLNWIMPRTKIHLKPFNSIAKKNNLKPLKSSMDLYYGDITLITNFLEFIDIFPHQQEFPTEDYIGIILLEELFKKNFSEDQTKKADEEIFNHLNGPQKNILLSMGSSGSKELFLKILDVLNQSPYNVIAVYTNILEETELPNVDKRILLKKYVPSLAHLHKMVDLSIIHGGQGTVYTAAYAGKPIIGYPMQFEQHLNLEKMVGHGAGVMLSKKFFDGENLIDCIENIFKNYNHFLENAQILSKKLPAPDGDKNAAIRITQIAQGLMQF